MIPPKVLLATTCRWPWVAQLTLALKNAGCDVWGICPSRRHSLNRLTAIEKPLFVYDPWAPDRCLRNAIISSGADIVVPCDDRVVMHLHYLHANSSADSIVVRCIERSLGDPAGFAITLARHPLLFRARAAGVPTPDSACLESSADLVGWLKTRQPPLVLKTDGSWGGKGVRIAHTEADAWRAYRELRRPLPVSVALKRWIAESDPFWIAQFVYREMPMVSVQSYIRGRPANCAAFCWKGRLLAAVSVEVLRTVAANGPAMVVRVTRRPEMQAAAHILARELGISGFIGLDFVIDDRSDIAQLVELNPRATHLSHIQLGSGADLPGSLAAAMLNRTLSRSAAVTTNPLIAYFPEASRMSGNSLVDGAYHDIPPV